MPDRIMTLHPDPAKQGVNIDRNKYETIKTAILDLLAEQGEITFVGLTTAMNARLQDTFDGSINWYTVSVKLDLEARGLIVRGIQGGKQTVRLKNEE